MQSKNLLGNTVDYFSYLFKSLKESKDDDKDAQHKLGFLYQHGYGVRKIDKRAIECYTKAAELGHTSAQYNLGLLYQENHDIKFNYRHAFQWYTKAAESGSIPAQNRLAYFYEKGLEVGVDYSKALYWYTQAATNNHKGAMLNVARIYRKGLVGGEPNYTEAIRWYTIASKQGSSVAKNCLYQLSQRTNIAGINAIADEALRDNESSIKRRLCSKLRLDISNLANSSNFNQLKELASHALFGDGNAMFELGFKYLEGEEFIQDREIGFIWIKKAAQSGLIKAQLYLARAYEEGITDFIKQDYYEARIWYHKVAKTKDSEAQNKIGLFYYQGHGLRKDPLEASKWFTWSSDQGNSGGQYMLGILRQKGEGLRKNSSESYEWLEKSASQGNPYALYQLSILYMKGKVLPTKKSIIKNPERALKMHKYAAHHGHLDAQLALAKMYEKEEKPAESFNYYLKAAKNGDSEAKYKIGHMYLHGRGVEQSSSEAFKWINDSAESKYAKAELLFATPIKVSDTYFEYYRLLEMFDNATTNEAVSLEYNIGYIYEKGLGDPNSRNFIKANPIKALDWYKKAEKKNSSKALYRLGKMYLEGEEVLRSESVASHYFKKSAELKNFDSLNTLALMYLGKIGVPIDLQEAFYMYLEAANLGCPNARVMLAILYDTKNRDNGSYLNKKIESMWEQAATNGNIVMQYKLGTYHQSHNKIDSAIKWYELAAHGGFAEACYNLGKIYEEEIEYVDYTKAIKMYEAATSKSHDMAMYRLALLYHHGITIQRDYSKAFQLYTEAATHGNQEARKILDIKSTSTYNANDKKSANGHLKTLEEFKKSISMCEYVAQRGNIDFQYKVGYVYEKFTRPREYNKAHKWYSMAASNSHKGATYRLGLLYKRGLGCSQNWPNAIKYFEKAMNLGSSEACFELGLIHHFGKGVEIDKPKAIHHYFKAADQGEPNAQHTLGKLYEDGDIVEKDLLKALTWYTKSYFQGNEKAIKKLGFLDVFLNYEEFFEQKLQTILENCAKRHDIENDNSDPEFYGHMYSKLGFMHFNRTEIPGSVKTAWKYLKIANERFGNKEALRFIDCVEDTVNESDKDIYRRKLEMFYEVIDDIDEKQLYRIGMLYYDGKKMYDKNAFAVEPNYELAFKFLKKSLDKGSIKSQKQLGDMYYYGKGVNANYKEGRQYHVAWANHQNGDENFQMGLSYYENPVNKEENKDIAFIYMNKALNQKNFKALEYLNRVFYSSGEVKKYRKKAAELHDTFANDQTTEENMNVGLLYYQGTSNINQDRSIAAFYLKNASSQGDPDAQRYLGDMYYHGDVEENQDEAIRLHELSANQRTGSKCFEIGQEYYKGTTLVIQNPEIALIYVTKAVEKDKKYQRYLADMYYYGEGVDEDQTEAVRLHELSASKLNSKENFDRGRIYYEGSKEIKKNHSIGFIYLDKAVNQGSHEAERYLGDAYYYGDGVEKSNVMSNRLHELSASRLKSEENFAIGREYYEGSDNVKKNHFIGLIYLNKAVSQGLPEAERYLGDAYYYGNGVKRNYADAKRLHECSANQLKSEENFNIGLEYYTGTGKVERNCSIAFIYFTKDDSKDTEATRYLGDMRFYGEGVEKDQKKAIELHKTAASSFKRLKNFETGLQYLKDSKNIEKNNLEESNVKKNDFVGILYISEAWNQQYAEAGRYLADMYQYGIGTEVDQIKATELYKSSSDKFGSRRNFEIGRIYYEGSEDIKMNRSAGLVYLTKAAEQGSSDAKRYLGDIYYYGDGVKKNQEKAISFYESSAKQSSPDKNFTVSQDYYKGVNNVKINSSVGLIYLSEAANREHPNARRYLGDIYYYSDDRKESKRKGIELYKSSASLFSSNEGHKIGEEYYKGSENVKKNLSIAVIYFTAAADKKNYKSQRYLGDMYLYGEGVEKDKEKANEFYKSSANGCTLADSVTFGLNYYRGSENTNKNYDTALIYFSKGSGTDIRATRYLGDMYYNGTGVEKNEDKAFELYNSSPSPPDRIENLRIGREYLRGSEYTNRNYSIALVYLKKAFDQDSGFAAQHLGDMYLHGIGVEQNTREAMRMFATSAKLLLKSECFEIGQEYFKGSRNISRNHQVARIYLTKAVNGDISQAERYLREIQD